MPVWTRSRSGPRRALLLAAGVAGAASSGCSPGYVLRAGWEEARILASRRPIAEVVHDTAAPAGIRAKLRLVEDARGFAEHGLGLDPGDSFRSYAEVPGDTLLLVVTAAEELALRWKTWWFPIVGRVPYRGYFDFERALREGERLRAAGYDVSIRPTSAFSSLGWLPDPLLSTTLGQDSIGLVETVIHEITHTTFFPAGQARFNESFATFVGHRGAVAFFCGALADADGCERARLRWDDTREFGRFFQSVARPLQELYASTLDPEEKRVRKRKIFLEAAVRFRDTVRARLRADRYGTLDPERLDNAWVLSRLLYYTRLEDFEEVYRRGGEDLRSAVQQIIRAARRGDPWEAMDRLVAPKAAGATHARPCAPAHRHPKEPETCTTES